MLPFFCPHNSNRQRPIRICQISDKRSDKKGFKVNDIHLISFIAAVKLRKLELQGRISEFEQTRLTARSRRARMLAQIQYLQTGLKLSRLKYLTLTAKIPDAPVFESL